MFTVNRVQAAPVVVCKRAPRASASRRPSSSTPAIANAATGEHGLLDARATAAETASALGLRAEQVLVLSTGVIGALLPLSTPSSPACAPPPPRSTPTGGDAAAQAIMTTDTRSKQAVAQVAGAAGGRLRRRRHGEGLRDDPPRPRDDARGRHHRLPARAGRGDGVPSARGRRELQRDHGRRRVLDQRHGDPARERRQRRRAHAGDRRGRSPARCARSARDLAKQIVADGEGATVLAEIARPGAVDRRARRRRSRSASRRRRS